MTRGALLLMLGAAMTVMAVTAEAAQPQIQGLTLAAGSTRSSVSLTVQAMAESRLAWQFELPLAVAQVSLVDPTGQARLLQPGRDLLVTDAAQRRQRERGHLQVLRLPVIDPAPGRWRLDIEHKAARGGEQLHLVVSQFPRFELQLGLVGGASPRIGAGSEQLIELRASDHGQPAGGLQPQASATHHDSGQRQPLVFWHERPASYDLPVQAEPGQYFSAFAPDAPGRYTVDLHQDFTGRGGQPQRLQRQLELTVAPQPVLQRLLVTQPVGPQDCVPRVDLGVDWPADRPGRHTLTVVLEGQGRRLQVQGGMTAEGPGPIRPQASVPARDLRTLGDDVQVRRVDLLHLSDKGFELLQRRRALRLSEPLATTRLCR